MIADDIRNAFPDDAHMPGVATAEPVAVRKVVAKVPVWEKL